MGRGRRLALLLLTISLHCVLIFALGPVLNLRVAELGRDTVSVTWFDSSNGRISYETNIAPIGEGESGTPQFFNNSYATWTNLIPGKAYTVELRSILEGLRTSLPAIIKFTTVPATPYNMRISKFVNPILNQYRVTGSKTIMYPVYGAVVSWDQPEDGYYDDFSLTVDPAHGKIRVPIKLKSGSPTQDNIQQRRIVWDLLPGVLYQFTVQSRSNGVSSNPLTGKERMPPETPGPITIEELKSSSVLLSWDGEHRGMLDGYVAETEPAGGVTIPVHDDPLHPRRRIENLTPGTKYKIDVFSTMDGLLSVKPRTVELNTPPEAPRNEVRSEEVKAESVFITWNPPPGGIEYYEIVYYPTDRDFGRLRQRIWEPRVNLTTLDPGSAYQTEIFAFSNDLVSDPLKQVVYTRPLPPNNVITTSTQDTIVVSWETVYFDGGAKVETEDEQGVTSTDLLEPGNNEITITDLESGTNYILRVFTIKNGIESDPVILTIRTSMPPKTKATATRRPQATQSRSHQKQQQQKKTQGQRPQQRQRRVQQGQQHSSQKRQKQLKILKQQQQQHQQKHGNQQQDSESNRQRGQSQSQQQQQNQQQQQQRNQAQLQVQQRKQLLIRQLQQRHLLLLQQRRLDIVRRRKTSFPRRPSLQRDQFERRKRHLRNQRQQLLQVRQAQHRHPSAPQQADQSHRGHNQSSGRLPSTSKKEPPRRHQQHQVNHNQQRIPESHKNRQVQTSQPTHIPARVAQQQQHVLNQRRQTQPKPRSTEQTQQLKLARSQRERLEHQYQKQQSHHRRPSLAKKPQAPQMKSGHSRQQQIRGKVTKLLQRLTIRNRCMGRLPPKEWNPYFGCLWHVTEGENLTAIETISIKDGFKTMCEPNNITVLVDKEIIEKYEKAYGPLHFNRDDGQDCRGVEYEKHYRYTIAPNILGCGTLFEVNDTHVNFTNTVSNRQHHDEWYKDMLDNTGDVLIGHSSMKPFPLVHMNIRCTFPLDMTVHTNLIPDLRAEVTTFNVSGVGQFSAVMQLFKDDEYRHPYFSAPSIAMDDRLRVGVTLLRNKDDSISIAVRKCWATPVRAMDFWQNYLLVDDYCPLKRALNGNLKILENGRSKRSRWEGPVFKFTKFDEVWLHCELKVCFADSCLKDCTSENISRKRRGIINRETISAVVTAGPIFRRAEKKKIGDTDGPSSPKSENSDELGETTIVIVVSVLSAVILLLCILFVILFSRCRRSRRDKETESITRPDSISSSTISRRERMMWEDGRYAVTSSPLRKPGVGPNMPPVPNVLQNGHFPNCSETVVEDNCYINPSLDDSHCAR